MRALSTAMRRAVTRGLVVVVAAGNEDADACTTSPASEDTAITVGATDVYDAPAACRLSECVAVYAPGTSIVSARAGSTRGAITMSGSRIKHDAQLLSGRAPDDSNQRPPGPCAFRVARYAFTITDEYGDGSYCGWGAGRCVVSLNGEETKTGTGFTTTETHEFGSCGAPSPVAPATSAPTLPPTPAPTSPPTSPPTSTPTSTARCR